MNILYFFLFFFTTVDAYQGDSIKNCSIEKQILSMYKKDKSIRAEILATQKKFGSSFVQTDSLLFVKLQEVDKENASQLKQIFSVRGWLPKNQFSIKSRDAFWTLIQHSPDFNLQKIALKALEQICKLDPTELKHYAYLSDRILMNRQKPQLFGTQGRCIGPNQWQPYRIANHKNINQLRKKMSLCSFEQYQKLMGTFCY